MNARKAIAGAGGLASLPGLAARWQISRQRAHQLSILEGFPAPIPVEGLRGGVYLVDEADAWRKEQKA